MARQVIDTTTNNGSYFGDPAKTAFDKVNAMTGEIYGWAGNGALAKLIGGNAFSGNQTVAGTLAVTDNISCKIVDAVGAEAALRFIDRTDFSRKWAWYSSGAVSRLFFDGFGDRLTVSYTGAVGAVSFNPSSSADIKDYIEGYNGDACAEIDRLVVITYKYRPEFGGPEGTVAGLLAENVQSVWPNAVGGDYDETISEPALLADGSEEVDEHGNPVMVDRVHHVPMNIDMMQTLARSMRAHQQKSARIKSLESAIASLTERLDLAGI